jgi:uncharacterized OB-fold protein
VTSGVTVSACAMCEWKGLPERLWCPRCGSDRVGVFEAVEGTLEEITSARRAAGSAGPVRVASVRIDGGGSLIVRLEHQGCVGEVVELEDDGGAAVARAQGARRG